ncbi:sensor domain-containing diguanylate cyclase [Arenimonas sp.]|uniref:sensor domain-containing diguanylate cyclase n=1 Tax=Arenimonas sp. TaxID=1872635 RepID=UPI002D1F9B26|nr:sensor domain-containing diguanylate cyclase [Arenimonas sp.]
MLTEILAQVSREALQGEGLEAVLQGIVDCLVRRLPVAIASIILLSDDGAQFTQEVWAGVLDLDTPIGASMNAPWPVSVGAAGRCARTGEPQLILAVEKDPDYVPGNTAVRSEYLVPIHHHDRRLGVLNVESTRTDFFTGEACGVFDAVAAQIAGAIHLARVVGELELANRKLHQLSMSDGLTGIANRRCFDQQLAQDWQRLAHANQPLALALVDADCFKALNDARGHLYGDECLRELARLCTQAAIGDGDLVARFGGEELVLLLPGRGLRPARDLAERLRRSVEKHAMAHPASPVSDCVTVSIGVSALYPALSQAPEYLVAVADRALYAAKARGRNCVVGRGVRMPR